MSSQHRTRDDSRHHGCGAVYCLHLMTTLCRVFIYVIELSISDYCTIHELEPAFTCEQVQPPEQEPSLSDSMFDYLPRGGRCSPCAALVHVLHSSSLITVSGNYPLCFLSFPLLQHFFGYMCHFYQKLFPLHPPIYCFRYKTIFSIRPAAESFNSAHSRSAVISFQ